jgi:hypothetical protein
MATPADGPNPGKTPITKPTKTPIKVAVNTLIVSADCIPPSRSSNESIANSNI